jgi:hypothetical protein
MKLDPFNRAARNDFVQRIELMKGAMTPFWLDIFRKDAARFEGDERTWADGLVAELVRPASTSPDPAPDGASTEPEPVEASPAAEPPRQQHRKLRDMEIDPERLKQAKLAEIAARYERGPSKSTKKAEREPLTTEQICKLIAAELKRSVQYLGKLPLQDDEYGRRIVDQYISLGANWRAVRAIMAKDWDLTWSYYEHIRRVSVDVSPEALGEALGPDFTFDVRNHPAVRAWNIWAGNQTLEMHERWKKEQRRQSNQKANAKRKERVVMDNLPRHTRAVNRIVTEEAARVSVLDIALKALKASEFRTRGRARRSLESVCREVRQCGMDLVAIGRFGTKTERVGSTQIKFFWALPSARLISSKDRVPAGKTVKSAPAKERAK